MSSEPRPMMQEVNATLKVSMWVDAKLDKPEIAQSLHAQLEDFARSDIEIICVQVTEMEEEAEIYHPEDVGPGVKPWVPE